MDEPQPPGQPAMPAPSLACPAPSGHAKGQGKQVSAQFLPSPARLPIAHLHLLHPPPALGAKRLPQAGHSCLPFHR